MLALLVLSTLVVQLLFPSPAAAQPDLEEPDIIALEQRVFRAIEEKNREALEELLTADFVSRGVPDIDRAQWLSNAVSLCWGPSWDIQQLAVREQDGTQVATFIFNFYRDPLTCRAAPMRSLITDLWVRRDNRWQLMLRHAGPVGEAGPRAQYSAVPLLPPPFEGRAELSFVSTGGNTASQTLGVSGELTRRAGRATTNARTSFIRTSNDDVESARVLTAQARHGVRLSDRVEAFARGGYLRDIFSGIEHRINADAGLSYVTRQPPQRALKFDFGLGATRENRTVDADQSVLNATFGISLRARLAPTAEVTAESQAVEDLGRVSNWRLANDVSLNATFNARLSARLAYATRFVNQPVPGFRRADHTVSAALVIRYVRQPPRPQR